MMIQHVLSLLEGYMNITNIDSQFYSQQYRDHRDPSLLTSELDNWASTPTQELDFDTLLVCSTLDSNYWDHPDALLNTIRIVGAEIDKLTQLELSWFDIQKLESLRERLRGRFYDSNNPKLTKALMDTIKKIDRCLSRGDNESADGWARHTIEHANLLLEPKHPTLSASHDVNSLIKAVGEIAIAAHARRTVEPDLSPHSISRLHQLRGTLTELRNSGPPAEVSETLEESLTSVNTLIQKEIHACRSDDFDRALQLLDEFQRATTLERFMHIVESPNQKVSISSGMVVLQKMLTVIHDHHFYLKKSHFAQLTSLSRILKKIMKSANDQSGYRMIDFSDQLALIKRITGTNIVNEVVVHLPTKFAKLTAAYLNERDNEPATLEAVRQALPPVLEDLVMEYHSPEIEIVTALLHGPLSQQQLRLLETSPLLCTRIANIFLTSANDPSAPMHAAKLLMTRFVDAASTRIQNHVFERFNRMGFAPIPPDQPSDTDVMRQSNRNRTTSCHKYNHILSLIPRNLNRLGLGERMSREFETITAQFLRKWLWSHLREVYVPEFPLREPFSIYGVIEELPLKILSIPATLFTRPKTISTPLSANLQELTIRGTESTLETNEAIEKMLARLVRSYTALKVLKMEYPRDYAKPHEGVPGPLTVDDIRQIVSRSQPDSNLRIIVEFRDRPPVAEQEIPAVISESNRTSDGTLKDKPA